MGCCTGRCFLIALCILQMVATIERQVFDFLGYMWAPIIGNFLHIIFIIVGFFGGVQYRPRVIIAYTVWCLVWIGWNTFVICFYLEVGILKRDSPILNLGTDNKSWWLLHGIGCQASNRNDTSDGSEARFTEEDVEGCLLQYYYVEIIHAGIQCLLSLAGFCVACYTVFVFTEEDDSSQPVHDELEYIKMRYRSPARSSFRDQKAYETLTSRSTYSSSVDRGGGYSDDSTDHIISRKHKSVNKGGARDSPRTTCTDIPSWTSMDLTPRQTELPPYTPTTPQQYIDRYGNEGAVPRGGQPITAPVQLDQDLGEPFSQYRYNLHGARSAHDATVI